MTGPAYSFACPWPTSKTPRAPGAGVSPEGPSLAVDAVIAHGEGVVLIERGRPPFDGAWALPGGFVEVGETVEQACVREALEETGLEVELTGLVGVYSDPARDPRGHVVSVTFAAEAVDGELAGGDDAARARVFPPDDLPELAFDHARILADHARMREAGRGPDPSDPAP